MKFSLHLLLVFLGLFSGSRLSAQANFVVDYNNVIDSNYAYNSFIPLNGTLSYFGSGIYQGTLEIGIGTFNSGAFIADTLNFSQQVTLQNQETSNFVVEIPVSPSFFLEGGGHTVIVWPIMTPEPPGVDIDSTSFTTNITGWLSQTEWNAAKQAKLFPIPAADFVVLQKPETSPVAEITVYDITGQTVYTGKATEAYTRIPLDQLPAGTYFVRYNDGIKPAEIHRLVKR